MNKEEILKLVNAGYTKAEIEAMSSDQKPGEPKPEEKPEEPKPEEKPEKPKPEEKPEVKPAETVSFTPEVMKEFTGAINGLSDMIKKSNMINDGYEPKTALEKGEEVLASLINPPAKKK